jgi:outer membrane protein
LTEPTADTRIEMLVAEARSQRADRQALVERTEAAAARVDAAEAGRRPIIGVLAGGDYSRPNPRLFPRVDLTKFSWDASVNLSWSLFDGGRTKATVAEATFMKQALEARTRELDSVLGLEVRQRVAELEAVRSALDAADYGLRSATEARRVVGDRYAAGVATSTDVLDAQNAVLQAQLDRTQALASARITEARLARALGR